MIHFTQYLSPIMIKTFQLFENIKFCPETKIDSVSDHSKYVFYILLIVKLKKVIHYLFPLSA